MRQYEACSAHVVLALARGTAVHCTAVHCAGRAGVTCAASSSSGGTAVRQPAIMSFAGWLQRFRRAPPEIAARTTRGYSRNDGQTGKARHDASKAVAGRRFNQRSDPKYSKYWKYFRCSTPRKKVAVNGGNARTEGVLTYGGEYSRRECGCSYSGRCSAVRMDQT